MNDYIIFQTKSLGSAVEVCPGFFARNEICTPKVTKSGRVFLAELCRKFSADEMSVEEFLAEIREIADDFPGWETDVNEALFFAASEILA